MITRRAIILSAGLMLLNSSSRSGEANGMYSYGTSPKNLHSPPLVGTYLTNEIKPHQIGRVRKRNVELTQEIPSKDHIERNITSLKRATH